MSWMWGPDISDTLLECHYDDRLWGYVIHGSEFWRNRDRDAWRDPVLSQLFKMGIFDWEGEDKLMHQAKQAVQVGTATSVRIWMRVLEIQEQVGPAVAGRLIC